MKRRIFLSRLFSAAGGALFFPSVLACKKPENTAAPGGGNQVKPVQSNGKIKFGVITDVHQDFFPEAEDRLSKFIAAANAGQVDFIIQLGDFSYPLVKNSGFIDIWNGYKGPRYHVLGNHDMDVSTKEAFLDFAGQSKQGAFYSFDQGGFHFVVLDTNYIKQGNSYLHYANKNYARYPAPEIGFVSEQQLDWLRDDLAKADKPTLVFSHQPLNGSAGNSAAVQQVFNEENRKGKKVIAAFSGHLHKNWLMEQDHVQHIQLNSASYFYVGKQFPLVHGRYPEAVEKKYTLLPQMAPYDNSLFAIVELDGAARSLAIEGRKANFIAPTPYELGYYANTGQTSPSSNLDSRSLKF